LNVTDVVFNVVATVFVEVSVSPAGVAGPIFVPKMEITSPGDTEPDWKLAPFTIEVIDGGPGVVIVRVTGIVCVVPVALAEVRLIKSA
jgi:ABC-type branched-subunit amino acid transport system permease subunit